MEELLGTYGTDADKEEAQKQILDTIVRMEDDGDIAIRCELELYG